MDPEDVIENPKQTYMDRHAVVRAVHFVEVEDLNHEILLPFVDSINLRLVEHEGQELYVADIPGVSAPVQQGQWIVVFPNNAIAQFTDEEFNTRFNTWVEADPPAGEGEGTGDEG